MISLIKTSNRGLYATQHSYRGIIAMFTQLTFVLTVVTASLTTEARDVHVFSSPLVYRYHDAVQICSDNGLELAWPHVIAAKLAAGQLDTCACGWTEERYAIYQPRCGTFDELDLCFSVPATGVSPSGLVVYCQTDDSIVDATNAYNYNVVFVPEENGSPILVNNLNPAKDVCTGLGVKLAYKSQLKLHHDKFGFVHCDCAWVREVKGVYTSGCPTIELFTQCTHDFANDYPVYCFGIPPDVNECAVSNPCGDNEDCVDIIGGFECNCVSGYTKNTAGVCEPEATDDPCDGLGPAELNGVPVKCRDGMILVQFNAPCTNAARQSFNKNWADYQSEFGTPETGYWAGLDFLHQTTNQAQYKLVVEIDVKNGGKYFAQYDNFVVGPSTDKYRLSVGAYSVPAGKQGAGDALNEPHENGGTDNGSPFGTPDQDNDQYENAVWYSGSCGKIYDAGWWFNHCHRGLLNGACSDDPRYWLEMSSAKQWSNTAWKTQELDQTWMMISAQ